MSNKLSKDECARIVSLFEMTERAAKEDADEFTRNEGINATAALFRLFTKHGLTSATFPKLSGSIKSTKSPGRQTHRRPRPRAISLMRSNSSTTSCTNGSMFSRMNTSASHCGFCMRTSSIASKSRHDWHCSARFAVAARPITEARRATDAECDALLERHCRSTLPAAR